MPLALAWGSRAQRGAPGSGTSLAAWHRMSFTGVAMSLFSRSLRRAATLVTASALSWSAQAQESFTFLTSWYAQAEHGGFYQALATPTR